MTVVNICIIQHNVKGLGLVWAMACEGGVVCMLPLLFMMI